MPDANDIVISLYVIFLAVFGLTAIIALGAVLRWRPFERVKAEHTTLLMRALIVEVVVGVIGFFLKTPLPVVEPCPEIPEATVKVYRIKFDYRGALEEFEKYLKDNLENCKEWAELSEMTAEKGLDDIAAEMNAGCKDILSQEHALEKVNNSVVSGDLYVGKDGKGAVTGKCVLKFPGEPSEIAMAVTGEDLAEKLDLHFTQPSRILKVAEEDYKERPSSQFTIVFDKAENGFEGTFFFPKYKIDGKKLDEDFRLATVRLAPKGPR